MLITWKIQLYTNFFLVILIANAYAFTFYIYKKNSHLIPQRSNRDFKFLLQCNFFILQPRVLGLAYLDSLSFSDSKYIYFYIVMTIITQVMGRQRLVPSRVTSNCPRSYLLNRWSEWPHNFRNGFRAHKLPIHQISAKSERWGC